MRLKFPKPSNREWMFGAAGLILGYLIVPKILHQSGGCTGKCGSLCLPFSPGHNLCQDGQCILPCDINTGLANGPPISTTGGSLLGSLISTVSKEPGQ